MGAAAKEQAPELVKLLRDPNREVRISAVKVLGAMGAAEKELIPELAKLLYDPDHHVRIEAAVVLGKMGAAAKELIPELVKLLHNPNSKNDRISAVYFFREMGVAAKEQAPELAKLLVQNQIQFNLYLQPKIDVDVARALREMGQHDLRTILNFLPIIYENSSFISEIRFLAHFLGGGNPNIEILLNWIGEPMSRPTATISQNHDLAVKTLEIFKQAWPLSEPFPKLRRDLETQIATVAQTGRWKTDDLPLLKTHATNLEAIGSIHAVAVLASHRPAGST